jgi:hypothetical protein
MNEGVNMSHNRNSFKNGPLLESWQPRSAGLRGVIMVNALQISSGTNVQEQETRQALKTNIVQKMESDNGAKKQTRISSHRAEAPGSR